MKQKSETSLLDRSWFAITVFVVCAIVVTCLWWNVPKLLTKNLTAVEKGVYGDSYGSVNALFTGLAFSGLIFTILLQLRELRLQRADFLNQLESMDQSREEIEEQNRILRAQIEVQILEVVTRAIEVEAQADALDAAQWVPGTKHHLEKIQSIRAGGSDIRKRAANLQAEIIAREKSKVLS